MVKELREGLRVVAVALLVVGCAWPASVGAIEQRALPPFQVQAPDGTLVGSGQVAQPGRQALVFVDADCETCALVFTAMAGLDPAEVEAVTFVVRGDAGAAASFMAGLTATMPNARWFVDTGGTAYTALKLGTSPVVLGLRSGRIIWARPGQVKNAASLNAALRSWLGPEPALSTPQP